MLMMHGLLQSSGAYCTNDDESLAFFLCKRYVMDVGLIASHAAVPTSFPHRLLSGVCYITLHFRKSMHKELFLSTALLVGPGVDTILHVP